MNNTYSIQEAADLMGLTYRSLYGRIIRRTVPASRVHGGKWALTRETIKNFNAGILQPISRESEIVEIDGIQYRRLTPDERTKISIRLQRYEIEILDKIATARKTHRNRIIESAIGAFVGRYGR